MSVQLFTHYADKLAEIAYKPQAKNAKGTVVSYCRPNEHTDANIKFQLQSVHGVRCRAPFGVSCFDENSGARKSVELSIEDESLVKFFRDFDERNVQAAVAKRAEWFKMGVTEDQVRHMYYPMIHADTTGKGYAPRLHTKITTEGSKTVNVLLYSEPNGVRTYTKGSTQDITKHSECMVICEATGLWFQNKQFGMSLSATDIIIFPREEAKEFGFIWDGVPPVKGNLQAVVAATEPAQQPSVSILPSKLIPLPKPTELANPAPFFEQGSNSVLLANDFSPKSTDADEPTLAQKQKESDADPQQPGQKKPRKKL